MSIAPSPRKELIELANDFGSNPDYSRVGGGNASVKEDGVLWIKPSGVPLATLEADHLVPLRIQTLLDALHSDAPVEGDPVQAAAKAARVGPDDGRRPSVEILFHALIPDPLVLHLHPIMANVITCNARGERLCQEILGDDAVWVDYIDPGVPLARGIYEARLAYEERTGEPAPAVTLLGNHGIIVAGESYAAVAERILWLTNVVTETLDAAPEPEASPPETDQLPDTWPSMIRETLGADAIEVDQSTTTRAIAPRDAAPVADGPLIPDQIVYAGSLPLVVPDGASDGEVAAALSEYEERHGRKPITIVAPERAVMAVGATPAAAKNALETFKDSLRVASMASRLGGVRVMDDRERHFIENWEAEAYRKSIAAKPQA